MIGPNETEIKIRLQDKAAALDLIRGAGFHESVPRLFEANTLYDTPDQRLRTKEMLLRIRQAGETSIVTWKGAGIPGPHKSRPEIETPIGSAESLSQIFRHLGFEPTFRYEKYRTEFTAADHTGTITLDETPIGDFLELEGPAAWIDQTAALLGFSPQQYILDSYGKLYIAECERRGVQPAHMVFASTSG
jgi:adenylate cyclase class 2